MARDTKGKRLPRFSSRAGCRCPPPDIRAPAQLLPFQDIHITGRTSLAPQHSKWDSAAASAAQSRSCLIDAELEHGVLSRVSSMGCPGLGHKPMLPCKRQKPAVAARAKHITRLTLGQGLRTAECPQAFRADGTWVEACSLLSICRKAWPCKINPVELLTCKRSAWVRE